MHHPIWHTTDIYPPPPFHMYSISGKWQGQFEGNELADTYARETPQGGVYLGPRMISMAFLGARRSRQATGEWRGGVTRRCRGGAPFAIPAPGVGPRILAGLRLAPKRIAARFFRLYSGHWMLGSFLKDKFGWIESDSCWWCGGGR